jgi:hypothetical protein
MKSFAFMTFVIWACTLGYNLFCFGLSFLRCNNGVFPDDDLSFCYLFGNSKLSMKYNAKAHAPVAIVAFWFCAVAFFVIIFAQV